MTGQTLTIKSINRNIKILDDLCTGDIIQVNDRLELVTGRYMSLVIITYRNPPRDEFSTKEIAWGERRILEDSESLTDFRLYSRFMQRSDDLAQQKIYQALDQLLNEHGITQ